jgi:hypothetical protein
MSFSVEIVKVTPLYPKKVLLQWDIQDPPAAGSYTFTIERSGSTSGPWTLVVAGLQNTYNYFDDFSTLTKEHDINLLSLQRNVYYRITAAPPTGSAVTSEPHGFEPSELSPMARGLRRRLRHDQLITYKKINGVKLAISKRRRWGPRCTVCFDPVSKAALHSHCEACYGTGFADGYWTSVIMWGRISPDKVAVQGAPAGVVESSGHVITLLDVPRLQDDDLITELDTNRRYVVRRQLQTELRRYPVHQQVQVSQLSRNAVEYLIAVDSSLSPPLL